MKRVSAENEELLSRLRQLEGMVEAAMARSSSQNASSGGQKLDGRSGGDLSAPSQHQGEGETGCSVASGRLKRAPLEHEFGRLVVEDNRSRYVNNRYWASLGDQVSCRSSIMDY